MKKHIIIFSLLFSLMVSFTVNAGPIEVSTTEINFGVVKKGTDKQETFTVTNTGANNVSVTVDASTEFTNCFEVSDNLQRFTLKPGGSKDIKVTSHGLSAGSEASTEVYILNYRSETVATVKLKAFGDDDSPLVDRTSLTMNVGEKASVYLKTIEYSTSFDVEGIVDCIGGGPGTSSGPADGHNSLYSHTQSGLTFTALKPGVVHVTFKHLYTDETAVLTITVIDPNPPVVNRYAIYNYRNDGDFNAFLNVDVDSITFSNIDMEGRTHPNVVVQEVWTPDSVYRIPLAAIDSIAFQAPKPIMQDGIFYLRDYHAAHTLAVDSLTLYFDNRILNDSLPEIGQVVLNAVETTPYEEGFAGKVVSIQRLSGKIKVECEMLCVHDVYKRLVLVGKVMTESEAEEQRHLMKSPGRIDTDFEATDIKVIDDLGTFSFPCLGGILTVESKNPSAIISYYVYIDETFYRMSGTVNILHKDLHYNINMSLQKIKDQIDLDDDLMDCLTRLWNYRKETRDQWIKDLLDDKLEEENQDIENPEEIDIINALWKDLHWSKTIPLAGPLVLDLEVGPLLKFKGDMELEASFKTTARNHFFIEAGGSTLATLANPLVALAAGNADISGRATFDADPVSDISIDAKVKGSLSAGITGKATISLIHKNVVHASVSGQGGLKLAGALDFKLLDTATDPQDMNLYERLKDTKIKADWFAKAAVELGVTKSDFLTAGMEWEKEWNIGTTYLVPHFTEPALPTYNEGNGLWSNGNKNHHNILESTPSNSIPHLLLGPCTLGMKIVDSHGTVVKNYVDDSREYDGNDDLTWGLYPISIPLDGLNPNETYRCYPQFRYQRLWTHFTTATPSHEFTVPKPLSFSQQSISLRVGDKKQGIFVSDGWGMYDINNENPDIVKMTRKDVGQTPNLTFEGLKEGRATIKAIDQYSGQEATLIVNVGDGGVSVNVPDEAIDLGLPSGTKWAPFNLGASRPEEFGGYYAWGETEVKEVYNRETYNYKDAEGNLIDLGRNICGTDYDAAHVNWGDGWRMPTMEELNELWNNCSHVWTTLNGSKGMLLTAPNGNSIFLPAAGNMCDDHLSNENNFGLYRAGTCASGYTNLLVPVVPSYLQFASYGLDDIGTWSSLDGLTIRPVKDEASEQPQTETFTVNGVSFKMIAVEGGTFMMGAADDDSEAYDFEKPAHQVTLSSFSVGQTEVTQALWQAVMDNNPSHFKGDLNRPVEMVSWDDCQTFIAKLNEKTGRTFRLLTEAEWEFAARGGNQSHGFKYSGSNVKDEVAWYYNNSGGSTHPVGTKMPNELGIYDMSGNVWEWVQDIYGYYSSEAQMNPTGPISGSKRVDRGGSWYLRADDGRVTDRRNDDPSGVLSRLGLRLAMSGNLEQQDNQEWVDLGLPSGTLWATCNVGASAPEQYGDYFAWGETEPKDYYDWSTYKWCNGSSRTLTKYCSKSSYGNNGFYDRKTELVPEDDAAYVNWGASWRMPSVEQVKELNENCTAQWTQLNGVNGLLVTGPNGKTLFLPAAGTRSGNSLEKAGLRGTYWMRTLESNTPYYAYNMLFTSGTWGYLFNGRSGGHVVRAVRVP